MGYQRVLLDSGADPTVFVAGAELSPVDKAIYFHDLVPRFSVFIISILVADFGKAIFQNVHPAQ
jgi:hypothetical protein